MSVAAQALHLACHTLLITMSISFLQQLLISMLLILLVSVYLYFRSTIRSKKSSELSTNWPIVHMLPAIVANLHNLLDFFTANLAHAGHNFSLPIPQRNIFLTCDPANIRHIFTTNHKNFPKGPEFAAIFNSMDRGIFTVDGESWRLQRAKFQSVISSPQLVGSMVACCHDKVKNGLLPLFTNMASTSTPFDMQEVIARFVFDLAATPLFGVDPNLLSLDMPPMEVAVAMDTVMDVALFRHIVPASCWKAMRLLNIGPERKLNMAHRVIRRFFMEMIERKRVNGGHLCNDGEQQRVDVLSSYINDPDYADDDLLRAKLLSIMFGGRDTIGFTLPWMFYSLTRNPKIISIIRNELSPIASHKVATGTSDMVIFEPEETKSLVYLKAVLYETLRLYPPIPIERKTVVADAIMPSGHQVHAGETVLISLHSMARMEAIWGEDCRDYNPDRWLSEDGNKLRYVPSHKFLSFNSGPRMCPGKEIAVLQLATVVAAVVWNFDMELVEGQSIQPKLSCTLQMKNGLTMILKKREI
ncbi:noroxomaritidine synthase 2-like [Triticum dicoccoides]|uniref:noroxomaritidine synthase 2-like n=1 Tax=Triticum dicoccoides TaxID=85692 RepID=UPI001890D44C|nr:noroxomaritidine synthase 2-like [Triticum dicoccoides]